MKTVGKWIQDDLDVLLDALPDWIRKPLESRQELRDLLEVVLDLGRVPEGRFVSLDVVLDDKEVTVDDLEFVVARLGQFGGDNRAGIPRTLHRISGIRNRKGDVVGITCRVGRAVFGTIRIIEDLVLSGKSVLLLGKPGVGKTTMLREVARVLADGARRRVIIVDTSNEIAGDGDIPHPAIGHARRMQVATPSLQHSVMIEAVENHMPEVIIIDEMGTEQEAEAARTIAERGVQLIATAHGTTLDNLILNPTLSDLIGGVQTVTLGDDEARRRGTQKTIPERKAPPTFDIVVEIQSWDKVAVHEDVADVVDTWLRGYPISPETRWLDDAGEIQKIRQVHSSGNGAESLANTKLAGESDQQGGVPKVFLFGIGREKILQVAGTMGLAIDVANELRRADVILTTKSHYRRGSHLVRSAEDMGKPIYVLRRNSVPQVQQFIKALSKGQNVRDGLGAPLEEAQYAAERVLQNGGEEELSPQRAYIRRLQHLLVQKYNLASTSRGVEPNRRVALHRP